MYLGRIVELADNDSLFSEPLHPYSEALLAAAPLPDPACSARASCCRATCRARPRRRGLPLPYPLSAGASSAAWSSRRRCRKCGRRVGSRVTCGSPARHEWQLSGNELVTEQPRRFDPSQPYLQLAKDDDPPPRIAILGFSIECNRFSPVTTAADFEKRADIRGNVIVQQARTGPCRASLDLPGFFEQMDRSGPWTPVPLRLAVAQPGGPVEQKFFDAFTAEIEQGLTAALIDGGLDGVFIVAHGAALSTESDDPDGDLYAMIRRVVGPDVPVIGTFDLHANVSRKMTDNLDVFVGYLENPHTDIRERGAEAARHMRAMLSGMRAAVEMIKLPLTPPTITLLTAAGPYSEMIRYGQTKVSGDIINVSIMAGFVYGDCPKNGYTAVVTAKNSNRRAAFEVARDICERTWAMRERFDKPMTSLGDAVKRAVDAGANVTSPPILLADVADNPGGGGRGNTTWLLKALVEADGTRRSHRRLQRRSAGKRSAYARHRRDVRGALQPRGGAAVLVAVQRNGDRDGALRRCVHGTPRHGQRRSCIDGPSALLQIGRTTGKRRSVVVISNRQQCLDPMQLELLGVDIAAARVVVLKSRGHFRAGFDEFFTPDRIIEVDCPGLTSPSLSSFQWTRLPRPVYPLDPATEWVPPAR
jgi:microcystin degradation protein MlrC